MAMGKAFKDSLKALEADIQHANTLASGCPRENGACFQLRLSYSPAARLFLCLVQWTDCHLAGALGLIQILIHTTYGDGGKTTILAHERKATLKEFYTVIFPSLLQLQKGITDLEDRKQRELCATRFKRKDELGGRKISASDLEREEECGICMEMTGKIVLPNCGHSLCMKCYQDWFGRSQSCPFCRDGLRNVKAAALWIYLDKSDIVDLSKIMTENRKRQIGRAHV